MLLIHLPSPRPWLIVAGALSIAFPPSAGAQTSNGPPRFVCSGTERYEGPNCPGATSSSGKAGAAGPAAVRPPNPAERAAEIERARNKLAQQNQATAAARARQAAAAEEQRRTESARQAEFLRERDATARGLKGLGTELDLRDAVRDTPSSGSGSTLIRPSQRRALQQAVCALSALTDSLGATGSTSTLSESIGQASSIMDGSTAQQKPCGEPPQWDIPPGVDVDLVVARARAIITTAQGMAQAPSTQSQGRPLTADEQRIQAAFRAQKQNEQRLRDQDAPAVAVQERINRVQERKFDPRDPAAIRREQASKDQLQKYMPAIESLKRGEVEQFLNLTDDVDALLGGSGSGKKP
jgi:hypothetical protein